MKEHYIHKRIRRFIKNEMNSVLDVGCQYGSALFPFEEKKFIEITGIDCNEEIGKYIFIEYLSSKRGYPSHIKIGNKNWQVDDVNLTNEIARKYFEDDYQEFIKKFEFIFDNEKGRIENFDLRERSYDIIIFSQILHFFEEEDVRLVVEKAYECLKSNGFIYFDFYTEDRVKKGDFGYQYISENVFIETNVQKRKYYLLRHSFIKELENMFSNTIEIEDNETRANKVFVGIK